MIKFICAVFCLILILFPLKANAETSTKGALQITLDETQLNCIAPNESVMKKFIFKNESDDPISIRLYRIQNLQDSSLYPILQTRWQTEQSETPFGTFDHLVFDWQKIDPKSCLELNLELHFPYFYGNEFQNSRLLAEFCFEYRSPKPASVNITADHNNTEADSEFPSSAITFVPDTSDHSFQRLSNCLEHLGTLITCILAVTAVYCLLGVSMQKRTGELFFPFGYRPVVILSGSMEEEIQTGSIVIVKKTNDIKLNDIIFFLNTEHIPVIHRYVGNNETGDFITKGDANPKEDLEPVTQEQILGKVVWHP